MKRRAWFAALAGALAAKAEKTHAGVEHTNAPSVSYTWLNWTQPELPIGGRQLQLRRDRPVNGECPVCGHHADPLQIKQIEQKYCPPQHGGELSDCVGGWFTKTAWSEPSARTVTCAWCRNDYTQYAKGHEPEPPSEWPGLSDSPG